jgi:2-polyprenyl-6-hydroxyphenyl methylase/3-demethylubiquinone-9 3-methyltransferase
MRKLKNKARALKQAWGTSAAKKDLWDSEYESGRWDNLYDTAGDFVYGYFEKYARKGRVLDLGCGSGNTSIEMDVDAYGQYTGVDISEVAVRTAADRSASAGGARAQKNRYLSADTLAYVPDQSYDLILFRESIYYFPFHKIKGILERYAGNLDDGGVLLVTLVGTKPAGREKILNLIEQTFSIVEKGAIPNSDQTGVVVFRTRPPAG